MAGQEKNEKPAKKPLDTQAPTMAGQEKNEKPAKKPLGTQAPTMGGQEQKEKPVIKPSEKPSEKQPARQKRQQNAVLASAGKHWQGMSIFARIMFVIGLYGAISYAIALVLVFAGVAETDGTLSVLLCLAHFILYVWSLFSLFSYEGAGYPGVYGALVSRSPLLKEVIGFLMIPYSAIYTAGGLFAAADLVAFCRDSPLVGTWVWQEFVLGMMGYVVFGFIWDLWRSTACEKNFNSQSSSEKT